MKESDMEVDFFNPTQLQIVNNELVLFTKSLALQMTKFFCRKETQEQTEIIIFM